MFYIIASESEIKNKDKEKLSSAQMMVNACKDYCEYKIIYPEKFSFTNSQIGKGDIFFRLSTTRKARTIEDFLIYNGAITTKKTDSKGKLRYPNFFQREELYENNGVPNIPTIPNPSIDKKGLEECVSILGGFPLIIKESGGHNGDNILKVDSMSSLISTLSYVNNKAVANIYLKKYIEHVELGRIIVVGNKAVASEINHKVGEDIRLNNPFCYKQEQHVFSDEVNEIAVKATNLLNLEFGGVDILFGSDGSPYIAEVNSPAAFSFTQRTSGVDIAREIVDFLQEKLISKSINKTPKNKIETQTLKNIPQVDAISPYETLHN